MFTHGYGFVVDYLAEILHNQRDVDYGSVFERYFTLSSTLSTRDRDAVRKTFSGLMKLVYPSGNATPEQMEPLLRCAIEGRKRVKDQLCRIGFHHGRGRFQLYACRVRADPIAVRTLEETDYPDLYCGIGLMLWRRLLRRTQRYSRRYLQTLIQVQVLRVGELTR